MLQLIHKYRRSLVGFLFLAVLAMVLSGFGLDAINTFSRNSSNYAIKVNDHEVSFRDLSALQRNSKATAQQSVDRLIASSLLEESAVAHGFAAGDAAVRDIVVNEIFQGNFNPQQYKELLRSNQMSPKQFEDTLKKEALRQQFTGLLSDVSFATKRETDRLIEQEETTYAVDYIEFDPAKHLSQTKPPSDAAVEDYYSEHSSEFEIQPGVKYEYVLFTPEQYEKLVEISEEDLELHYADNESDFATPEAVHARHIRLMYAKDAKPEQMLEVKEKANQILSRVQAGESFEALALEFSDDSSTKSSGGDLGVIEKGKMAKEFDAAAFKLRGPGITELVSTDYGFHIVKVEEYKPAGSKPLAEVREQITKELQKRESPVYAAERAQTLFEEWKKAGFALSEFAAKQGLTAASTNGVLASGIDPEELAKGLTAAVLDNPGKKTLLLDIDDKAALVEVKETRESDIAPLTAVKQKIEDALRKQEAAQLAKQQAQSAIDGVNAPGMKLNEFAAANKLEVKSSTDVRRNGGQVGIFANPKVIKAIASTSKPLHKPSGPFEIDGKYYVIQVTGITRPDKELINTRREIFSRFETARLGSVLVETQVNALKGKAVIDINPQALAEG